jgi:hypothetical protein
MTQRASPEYGRRLAKAATHVIEHVREGLTPTQALVKAARTSDLTDVEIQRTAETYNKVATLRRFEATTGAEKAAAFDLADADAAIRELRAPTQKAASVIAPPVPDFFKIKPVTQKVASRPPAPAPAPKAKPTKQASAMQLEADVVAKRILAVDAIKSAAQTIKAAFENTPFHVVEQVLHVRHGAELAAPLCELLFKESDGSRYGQRRATAREINYSANPTAMIHGPKLATFEGVFSAVNEYAKALAALPKPAIPVKQASLLDALNDPPAPSVDDFHTALSKVEVSQPFQPPAEPDWNPFRKAALFPLTEALVGSATDSVAQQAAAGNDAGKKKIQDALSAQTFEDQLAEIRAQSAINEMFTDDVISSYDPDEITEAINDVAKLTPALLTQPALLRAQVRQRLASGGMAPFDLSAQLKQEEQLKSLSRPAKPMRPAQLTGDANG